jgi:Na+/proline symporter
MANPWAIFILVVINVANIIFLYRFIGQMNVSQCRQCTSEWRRSFLYYYSTFILILYAINIVLMVIGFIVLSGMSRSDLSRVMKSRIKNRK